MSIMSKSDIEFIEQKLLPYIGRDNVRIAYSASKKRWPDIWVEKYRVPVITITDEWKRQPYHERRKRLVHEGLHLRGMEHNEQIGYFTKPARDIFSKAVYEIL